MNILVFTEGTILVFLSGKNLPREEVVRLSQQAVVQRVVRNVGLLNALSLVAPKGSVYDFTSYVPIQHAVEKLTNWSKQGATIHYLTSRRTKMKSKR